MRKKQIELEDLSLDDIGFVGGGRPWTEADKKLISAYFQGDEQTRRHMEQQGEKKHKSLKKSMKAVNKLKKAS